MRRAYLVTGDVAVAALAFASSEALVCTCGARDLAWRSGLRVLPRNTYVVVVFPHWT